MMRRGVRMPTVERLAVIRRAAPVAIEPASEAGATKPPRKIARDGYQWPERGAIDDIFREAKKYR